MRVPILCALAALLAAPLAAQQPTPERGALRQRIQQAFLRRVTEELGLTPTQVSQLRATEQRMFTRRRTLEGETRRLNQALARQLRPGVAANPDSVATLTDSLLSLRVSYARVFQEEEEEMSHYLTPVQRGQYYLLRERLLQRVQEVRKGRRGGAAADSTR